MKIVFCDIFWGLAGIGDEVTSIPAEILDETLGGMARLEMQLPVASAGNIATSAAEKKNKSRKKTTKNTAKIIEKIHINGRTGQVR